MSTPLLAIRVLEKSYARFTLSIKNLDIRCGDVVGLLGANGAGKTTLIRSLVGTTRANQFDALWLGKKIVQENPAFKTMAGYVPEEPILYEKERVADLFSFVASLYPQWDSTVADSFMLRFGIDRTKKVSDLSKGMRTKLLLIMALAHKPELLILDEPTNGLDPLSRDEFLQMLNELMSRGHIRAAIISSHQLEDVGRICNRAVFLAAGKIVYDERTFDATTLRQLFESHRPAGRLPSF